MLFLSLGHVRVSVKTRDDLDECIMKDVDDLRERKDVVRFQIL